MSRRERLLELGLAGDVGEDAQLDLRVVRGQEPVSRLGDEALRISRPSSVRMGIACRFGLEVERRPVEKTPWLKVVCSLPSSGEMRLGRGPRYVLRSFEYSRYSSMTGHDHVLVADRAEHARVGG